MTWKPVCIAKVDHVPTVDRAADARSQLLTWTPHLCGEAGQRLTFSSESNLCAMNSITGLPLLLVLSFSGGMKSFEALHEPLEQ
jgi:hypothetical protein